MSLAKHNKVSLNWGIDTEGWEYRKAVELDEGKLYPVKGIFFTADNGYGKGAVIISDGYLVNVPGFQFEEMQEVVADLESVAAIKAGTESFSVEKFRDEKHKKDCAKIIFA